MVSRIDAVASSLVRSQRAMLPAPTSVTVAGGAETVTNLVPTPAAPSLSVTVTRTVLVPAAAYVWVAAIGLAWLVAFPVVGYVPSPQSTDFRHGASFLPRPPVPLAVRASVPPRPPSGGAARPRRR